MIGMSQAVITSRTRAGRKAATMERRSEDGVGGEDEIPALRPMSDLDAHGRDGRSMEANAKTVVGLQVLEIEMSPLRRHLAGIEEQRHVERESIGEPSPLDVGQHAMAIAEAPAVERTERAAAAERG